MCPTIKNCHIQRGTQFCESFCIFAVYKYQLFEHVIARYKEVRYTFCCDVLLQIEYNGIFTAIVGEIIRMQ